jgi:transposase InsO family protein
VDRNDLFVLRTDIQGKADRIVVPDALKAFVLGQHHNLPLHAHQGAERMLKMIASRYYWPGMARDVKRWVNSCSSCARRKTTRNMNMGLTTPALATAPWQVVGIDLVGKCVETTTGCKYILTIVDHFTRWPIAIPIPDKRGETVAKALYQHLIVEHGVPIKILSDQGKEFVNEGIATLCNKWGIKQVKTGGYNPQANGVCERFHRWMNTAMTQLYDRKDPDWDLYIPAIVFAYRVSVNDSTGYSPFFLNTGRDPLLPADVTFVPEGEREERDKDEYAVHIAERLERAFALARDKQYVAHKENVERKPDRQRPEFESGDLILLYSKTTSEARMEIAGVTQKREVPTKWRNPWKGPGTFVKKVTNTECEISLFGKTKTVNYNRIGPFTPWDLVTVSSDEWGRRLKKDKGKGECVQEPENGVEISEGDKLRYGDIFLFLMSGGKGIFHGFGVGLALNIAANGYIHFQWMGNFSDSHSPTGSFRLGWIDTTKNKEYFRERRERNTHTMFTGQSTDTKIHKEDVIMVGEKKILTKGMTFTAKALNLLKLAKLEKVQRE